MPQVCGHTFYDLVSFDCKSNCICRRAACVHGMSGCSCTVSLLPCHDCSYTSSSSQTPVAIPLHVPGVPNHTTHHCKSIMCSHSIQMIADLGCLQSRQQHSWKCCHTCCKCHCSCQLSGLTALTAILQGGSAAHACVVLSIMLSLEGCYVSGAASNHLVSSRVTFSLQSFNLLLFVLLLLLSLKHGLHSCWS